MLIALFIIYVILYNSKIYETGVIYNYDQKS